MKKALLLLALLAAFSTQAQNFSQMIKLIESDRENKSATARVPNDLFGWSVSVSGDYAIVGAYQEDEDGGGANFKSASGAAYIFYRSGSTWTLQQKLAASDRAVNDNFGWSVAISGDYAVVGAYAEDEDASGNNTASSAGSAYIFYRSGTTWTQQQKIVSSDRAAGDNFGISVSISGDYIIAGANFEDEDASGNNTAGSAGSAYIFTRSGTTWSQQQKIVASDRVAGDFFGGSVAISGDYAVVGAYVASYDAAGLNFKYASGGAYVYVRSGTTWSQQQKLVASDRAINDQFGTSVAIGGDYIVVGATYEDEDAAGLNTKADAGSAYIFYRSGTTWGQQQKIVSSDRATQDLFGKSVAISGDYVVIGAFNEDEDAAGLNTASTAGSAYVYIRSGTTWSQQQKIVASDRAATDYFGYAVGISGDYIMVGAPQESEDAAGLNTANAAGSAYVFNRSSTTWSQQNKVVALDKVAADQFGNSVAVDGDYAIVGAPGEDEDAAGGSALLNAGAAYIFFRTGGVWTFQQKIVASDRGVSDGFGTAVAISGDYVIVSAMLEDEDASGLNTASSAGSAYIFNRSGTVWTQQQKIVASDRAANDYFGNAVSISGDYAIVGAQYEDEDASGLNTVADAGSVYIFNRSGTTWTQQQKIVPSDRGGTTDLFGYSVAISGDYAIVSAYLEDQDASGLNTKTDAGSAYIFYRSGSTWTQQQKIVASDRASLDYFGISVAISGDYAIVGAYNEDEDAAGLNTVQDAGSAYIYVRSGTTWSQQQKIVASDRAAYDNFGVTVAISGDKAVVGANAEDEDAAGLNTLNAAGSAYIFTRSGMTWSQLQKIVPSDRGAADAFSNSVAISGNYVLVGANAEDEDAAGLNTLSSSGSAYMFEMSAVALPVGITMFSAKLVNEHDVLLTWNVANPSDGKAYIIERSADGQQFSAIGRVPSTSAASYNNHDYAPLAGRSYYRLRIEEPSGAATYSNVASIFVGSSSHVTVAPIPANDYIIISTNEPGITATITDLQGKEQMRFIVADGTKVNIRLLPMGIYLLRLSNGGASRIIRQ